MWAPDNHIIVAGSEKKARAYWASNPPDLRGKGIYPTSYFTVRDPNACGELREYLKATSIKNPRTAQRD